MAFKQIWPGSTFRVNRSNIRDMFTELYQGIWPSLKIGDVEGGDYLDVDEGGHLTLHGDATVWDDQQVSLANATLHPTIRPTWVDYKNSQVLAFGSGAEEAIYFNAQLSHKYQVGEDIDFHIHTVNPAAITGTFIWELSYSWASIGSAFPTPTVVQKTVTQELQGAQDIHTIFDIADLAGDSKGISSFLLCRLRRLGSTDTSTQDAHLVGLDFHIPMDAMGSDGETSK